MPDFSHLLRKPAGVHKRPDALPASDYPVIIKKHEVADNNKNRTPYVRLSLGYLDWPDTVEESERLTDDGEGGRKPIDLAKRQATFDFYLTDDALWRLDSFLEAAGIQAKGRFYEEIFPELHGLHCIAAVIQRMDDEGNTFNRIDKLVGIKQ